MIWRMSHTGRGRTGRLRSMGGVLAAALVAPLAWSDGLSEAHAADAEATRLTVCWNGRLTVSEEDFLPGRALGSDLEPGMSPQAALARLAVVPPPAELAEGDWMLRVEVCRAGADGRGLAMAVLDDGGVDDSVRSSQRLLLFERGEDGRWHLVWAGERWRCRRGAVPGRWRREPCP